MSLKDKEILCQVSNLAGKNEDIYNAVKQICIEWSDKSSDNLLDTYEYLQMHKPDKLEMFMSLLRCMVSFSD